MDKLSENWLTEGLIDFEYKKYVLLAYLQGIHKEFERINLFPSLSELITHYQNLTKLKNEKDIFLEEKKGSLSIPPNISKADYDSWKKLHKVVVTGDDTLAELDEIITYALEKFDRVINEGKEIFDFVEDNIDLLPVGITPMYLDEGYLFLAEESSSYITVYRYRITVFENATTKFRGLNTEFVMKDMRGFGRSFENIKVELAQKNQSMPNPATYAIVSKMTFPKETTLLPVAKRMLIRYLSDV